jgi:TonB family protein
MRERSLLAGVTTAIVALFCATGVSFGQTKTSSDAIQEQHVVLSKLSSPVYPPLARQARIAGDVKLELRIRPDGSIDSAQVVSGHPMLEAAALDSAKTSEFECHNCSTEGTGYSLVYTFALSAREKPCEPAEQSPSTEHRVLSGVSHSENHVMLIAEPIYICDPGDELKKVRSIKCLYLWKCAWH